MSSDSDVKPGASASENESADALTLLTQGKRHMLVKDYSEAVSSLGQACGLLASKYGETADECGEAYLFYGRALLELARTETGVLGDAIGDEGSAEDSDEEAEEPEENGKDKEEDNEKDEANTSADADETATEEKGKEAAAAASTAEGTEQEDEEEVSNLKLSWEMLELAKIIFQRQTNDKQVNLKLAEVYLNLGEVSLESETYDQAIQDLQSGLAIQKELLEEDDRRIAETYYRLGLAYSLNNEFDKAFQFYSNALETLELRVKNLELKHASGDKPQVSDAFYTIEGEIKELNEIIPDVKEKMLELEEVKAETLKAVTDMLKEGIAGSSKQSTEPAPKPVETKPASNITHLVRKKQKVEESSSSVQKSPSSETVPTKIQKSE